MVFRSVFHVFGEGVFGIWVGVYTVFSFWVGAFCNREGVFCIWEGVFGILRSPKFLTFLSRLPPPIILHHHRCRHALHCNQCPFYWTTFFEENLTGVVVRKGGA